MFSQKIRHNILKGLGLTLALSSFQAEAKWLEATGQASIQHQDLVSARRAAIRDAIQQVSLQAGADVSSFQQMTDGAITADNLRVSSNGSVQDINILKEEIKDGIMYLTISADVITENNTCGTESSNDYLRSAAISSFYLADPQSSTFGGLYKISQKLPADLSRRLSSQQRLRVLDASEFQVYNRPEAIPTSVTEQGTLTTAVSTAGKLGVQYVVSGVIRDISMVRPDLLREKSYIDQIRDKMEYEDKRFERRFQMDIYVHDGFSGSMVYSQRYDTQGNWNIPLNEKPGFGAISFWNSDYGQKVNKVMEQAAEDLQASLGCQPFMAKITRTDGRNIYINSGADAGLRPGDTLNIYRLSTFYDNQQNPYTELENVKLVLTLKKVQPFFARGQVATDPDKIGIQQGDVVIAW
ncbi:flagellar assembly protein T N-terminal domain-containing protein [Oceanospirillum beijerinckii]|uniref:flagellar assembly protein T N-terminal domain-containing protein n=1 Tax=Oceanospirillum beijerinckii TaxID=64976 RepID=UPI0003FB63EE|nr:flagella assembly protein FlgT [Oceanospirillum beijerinckii]